MVKVHMLRLNYLALCINEHAVRIGGGCTVSLELLKSNVFVEKLVRGA
jgi:hypothetical protein